MPLKPVADLFEQRLVEQWTQTPIISYDTIAEPPDVPAFVVQQYPVVQGLKPTVGRRFFEEGVYRLVLNVRRGIGLSQGLTWTDGLLSIFRAFKFPNGQLETFTPDGPIIDDNSEEGDWIVYSLLFPYRYQYDSDVPIVIAAAAAAGGQSGTGT